MRFVASESFTYVKVQMPGLPSSASETSYSRSTNQPSHQDAYVHLSAEERLAADQSLAIYCKPIELYNMIQERSIGCPIVLPRCLNYKIEVKNKKRIQMTASLSWGDEDTRTVFPLYICLAMPDPNKEDAGFSAAYQIKRKYILRDSFGIDGSTKLQADLILPELKKLAVKARSGSFSVLIYTRVENPDSSSGVNASLASLDLTSYESIAGEYCLYGKVSLESLYLAWNGSPNFRLGQRAEMVSTVDMLPCILKLESVDKSQRISIKDLFNSESERKSTSKQVQITFSAEEFGAKERSPYLTYSSRNLPCSPLSRILRLKEGNVMFHYRYYNNRLQRTEATEDFICPFCLVACASYKGLRCHLVSSHDLFNFEFSASEDCPAVTVSVKTDIQRYEIDANGISEDFIFCAKPFKRRRPENVSFENEKDADPLVLESEIPAGDTELLEKADSEIPAGDTELLERADSEIPAGDTELLEKADGVSNAVVASNPDPDNVPPIPEHDHGTPAVLKVAKKGKLPVGRSGLRNNSLLKKRQFYHSRRGQPMALEEVLSGWDSEDERDEEIENLEEQLLNPLAKEHRQAALVLNNSTVGDVLDK
ncbi:Polycomb protein, VEFS-Box [Sesbania bispinosa]|nr:Polycomb protein, VEFS-Box [Sesbania bispinosa]